MTPYATELQWLRWFYANADLAGQAEDWDAYQADQDARERLQEKFEAETRLSIPFHSIGSWDSENNFAKDVDMP